MIKIIAFTGLAVAIAPAGYADDCTAKLPTKVGATFSGIVKYVGDGDSLCVGNTSEGKEWIEVRLVDFDAPEIATKEGQRGRAILESATLGKSISCTVQKGRIGRTTSWDRVFAVCRIDGSSVADLLKKAGAPTGGK